MTSKNDSQFYGPPPPITKLTVEQDLKLRILHDRLKDNYHDLQEEVSTLILALQHQNFVMGNSITNLVKSWPPPPPVPSTTNEVAPMFGILLETKD